MKVLELAAWGRTAVEGFSWPFVDFSKAFQSPSKYSLIYCKAFWNPAITETFGPSRNLTVQAPRPLEIIRKPFTGI